MRALRSSRLLLMVGPQRPQCLGRRRVGRVDVREARAVALHLAGAQRGGQLEGRAYFRQRSAPRRRPRARRQIPWRAVARRPSGSRPAGTSLASSSPMPASCSMTSGPFMPRRAWRVTMSRLHSAAASDMPPKQPTMPGHHADDRHVAAQRDDRRVDLGDRGEPEVRLLQAHPAGFQQQQRRQRRCHARSRAPRARAPPAILAPDTSPMLPPW